MAATRTKYTPAQLDQYFTRIALPSSKRIPDVSNLPETDQLTYLSLLQKHHLVKIPWENLTQHYSWHRTVHLDAQHLFRKIVLSPNGSARGGYCMEANYFHHLVLFSLGFKVMMAGSRIHRGDGMYGGWTHVVNLLTIAGKRYLLDGGFGPQGPSRPLLLEDGVVRTQIRPAECRVVRKGIKEFLDPEQRVWVYELRKDEKMDTEWKEMYCFTDYEFTPHDVESMNFAPWLNKQSFFTHKVVAVRFTTSREKPAPMKRQPTSTEGQPASTEGSGKEIGPGPPGEDAFEGSDAEIDGSMTLNQDRVRWRKLGKVVLEKRFATEGERVEALERYFGIVLDEDEKAAIKGTAAEIGRGLTLESGA
jgi:arylamine N-acetyltransferase